LGQVTCEVPLQDLLDQPWLARPVTVVEHEGRQIYG
jgi:hypothetical protein